MNSEGGMGDNLTCNTCGKQLSSQASLLEHQRTHTGERPHSCNVCEKRFTQRAHLIIHKRTHTGEKPYACHICNKRFAQSSHLNGHKRIHTGEKPYSCSICNMGFCRKQRLEVHIKQHATEAEGSTWHSLDDPICESKIGLVSQVTPLNDLDGGDQGELSPLVSHTRRRKPSVVRKLNTETAMNVVKTELDEFDAESDGLTSGQSDWLDMTLQSLQTAKSPVLDVTNQPVFPSTHPPYSFKTDHLVGVGKLTLFSRPCSAKTEREDGRHGQCQCHK